MYTCSFISIFFLQVDWVEFGSQSQTPPNKPQGPVLPPHLEAIVKGGAPPEGAPATSVVSAPPPAVAKPASLPTAGGLPNASSAIVRPIATTMVGRPSIANTTNIDTLLNARQKSGVVENPTAPSDKVKPWTNGVDVWQILFGVLGNGSGQRPLNHYK